MKSLLENLDVYSFLIPFVVGIFNYRFLSGSILVCFLVVSISGFLELLCVNLVFNNMSCNTMYNLYIPVFNFLWWLVFYLEAREHRKNKKIHIFLLAVSELIIISMLVSGPIHIFDSIALSISTIHLIILCMIYLYYVGLRTIEFRLEYNTLFLIACGLLLYNTFTISIYLATLNYNEELADIWVFKKWSQIALNLLIAYVFLRQKHLRYSAN